MNRFPGPDGPPTAPAPPSAPYCHSGVGRSRFASGFGPCQSLIWTLCWSLELGNSYPPCRRRRWASAMEGAEPNRWRACPGRTATSRPVNSLPMSGSSPSFVGHLGGSATKVSRQLAQKWFHLCSASQGNPHPNAPSSPAAGGILPG